MGEGSLNRQHPWQEPGAGSGSSRACNGHAGSRCTLERHWRSWGRARTCSCPACSARAESRRTAEHLRLSRIQTWSRRRSRRHRSQRKKTHRPHIPSCRCHQRRTGRSLHSHQQAGRRTRPKRSRIRCCRRRCRYILTAERRNLRHNPHSPILRFRRSRSCWPLIFEEVGDSCTFGRAM